MKQRKFSTAAGVVKAWKRRERGSRENCLGSPTLWVNAEDTGPHRLKGARNLSHPYGPLLLPQCGVCPSTSPRDRLGCFPPLL
jgi:hypothetical protein